YHINLFGHKHLEDGTTNLLKFAEFYKEGAQTYIGFQQATSRIRINYAMYSMFDEKIFNNSISELQYIDEAIYRIKSNLDDKSRFEDFISNIQDINLRINVNWMPLWSFHFSLNEVVAREEVESGYVVSFAAKAPETRKGIVEIYEGFFTDRQDQP